MNQKVGGNVRVGIGGWSYEPWRGSFYPEKHPRKNELAYASRQLATIEINSTFYRGQKPESFAKWFEQTPEAFVFSVKAPRYATHRKALAEAGKSAERFLTSGLAELQHKLGPINWQLPPSKAFDAGDIEAFLKLLPRRLADRPLQHAIEARHPSFRSADFIELARQYEVAVVIAADSKYPLIADLTAPFVYARLMGTQENEPLGYSDAALARWAERAKAWAAGTQPEGLAVLSPTAPVVARDVYVYIIGGYKVANPRAAVSLTERLG